MEAREGHLGPDWRTDQHFTPPSEATGWYYENVLTQGGKTAGRYRYVEGKDPLSWVGIDSFYFFERRDQVSYGLVVKKGDKTSVTFGTLTDFPASMSPLEIARHLKREAGYGEDGATGYELEFSQSRTQSYGKGKRRVVRHTVTLATFGPEDLNQQLDNEG